MSQEIDLLKKLYDFYEKRYKKDKTILEDRFNNAIVDLIRTGDVKKATYYEFCVDHDIEPRLDRPVERPIVQNDTPPNNYNYQNDGCGGGGGYGRSAC